MQSPLYIAFLWHMHQPYYKEEKTGVISMPWVRLHAIKDYLDMVEILSDFTHISQTFNFSPCLLDQIDGYVRTRGKGDKFLEISAKPASELDESDQDFLLLNFFMANWETMVKPHLRYYDLLVKRGRHMTPEDLPGLRRRFSVQDYLDLQVWFNLSWFDPVYQEKDKDLKELVEKGSNFQEEDKRLLLDKQFKIMEKIIPAYRKFREAGQIEISVSPYYHPILPLLCDLGAARRASASIHLPQVIFQHPGDARRQISEAVSACEKYFGVRPQGMWPSEGAVSEEIIPFFSEAGISWIATDEDILFRSSGGILSRESLYQPYRLGGEGKPLSILFRDRHLSDAIGFRYQNTPPEDAAADFIRGLRKIRESLPSEGRPHLVTVILDGENAWEYYPRDGVDFLRALYRALGEEKDIKAVAISDFLKLPQETDSLKSLHSGSWINADFRVWIGHPEKNKAWEYLAYARKLLEEYEESHPEEREKLAVAWKLIYICEGSDWNWWFGDDHTSSNDEEFDKLYRAQLSYLYELLGEDPPEYLSLPITEEKEIFMPQPSVLLKPVLDGIDTHYYEWAAACHMDVRRAGGTMQRAESIVSHIYYGFDLENFFLRLDLKLPSREEHPVILLNLDFPLQKKKVEIPLYAETVSAVLSEGTSTPPGQNGREIGKTAFKDVLELGIKFSELGISAGERFDFAISVFSRQTRFERWPAHGEIPVSSPTKDYEMLFWHV